MHQNLLGACLRGSSWIRQKLTTPECETYQIIVAVDFPKGNPLMPTSPTHSHYEEGGDRGGIICHGSSGGRIARTENWWIRYRAVAQSYVRGDNNRNNGGKRSKATTRYNIGRYGGDWGSSCGGIGNSSEGEIRWAAGVKSNRKWRGCISWLWECQKQPLQQVYLWGEKYRGKDHRGG